MFVCSFVCLFVFFCHVLLVSSVLLPDMRDDEQDLLKKDNTTIKLHTRSRCWRFVDLNITYNLISSTILADLGSIPLPRLH